MANLLKFIDMDKYILLYQFFNNNNLPKDVLIYIVDTSIPFDLHIINYICRHTCVNNKECIFLCNNIFDKFTCVDFYKLIDTNLNNDYFHYFIMDDNDQYIFYVKHCNANKPPENIKYINGKEIYTKPELLKYGFFLSGYKINKKFNYYYC